MGIVEICVDEECAGVDVGYEFKGFRVGFAGFYDTGVRAPFLDQLFDDRPLDGVESGWVAECLIVEGLDLGVSGGGYFLEDEVGFEELYADF